MVKLSASSPEAPFETVAMTKRKRTREKQRKGQSPEQLASPDETSLAGGLLNPTIRPGF